MSRDLEKRVRELEEVVARLHDMIQGLVKAVEIQNSSMLLLSNSDRAIKKEKSR